MIYNVIPWYTTIHHDTLRHTTIRHNIPRYTTIHHNTPQYTTIYYDTPQYTTIHHNIPWYATIYHDSLQYTTIYHDTPQYIMIHHNTPHYTTIHHDVHQAIHHATPRCPAHLAASSSRPAAPRGRGTTPGREPWPPGSSPGSRPSGCSADWAAAASWPGCRRRPFWSRAAPLSCIPPAARSAITTVSMGRVRTHITPLRLRNLRHFEVFPGDFMQEPKAFSSIKNTKITAWRLCLADS